MRDPRYVVSIVEFIPVTVVCSCNLVFLVNVQYVLWIDLPVEKSKDSEDGKVFMVHLSVDW
jgi:hypothetical protein